MIRKISIAAIILCAFSIQSIQARAATLSFDPGSQTVGLGDPVTVDLRISDLGGDILTGFDLDISFDSSILGFQNFIFGTELGSGSDQTVDDSVAGLVNVFELSFESDSDLMSSQANDFILGTFNFDTLSLGTSALDISFALLAGEFDETWSCYGARGGFAVRINFGCSSSRSHLVIWRRTGWAGRV